MTLTPTMVKSNAKYTCRECGKTEFIHAHHKIPRDDNSLICLCAGCHSKKHPNMSVNLFFSKHIQPYWTNKSAASLGRLWGISSRTVIRTARRLGLPKGTLTTSDEKRLEANIDIVQLRNYMAATTGVYSIKEVAKLLNLSQSYIYILKDIGWIKVVKIGRFCLILKEEVQRYKENHINHEEGD